MRRRRVRPPRARAARAPPRRQTRRSTTRSGWLSFASASVLSTFARRLVLLIRFVPIDDGLREPLVLIREAHDLFLHLVALARRWTLGPLKGSYGSSRTVAE